MFYRLTAAKFLLEGSPPNLAGTGPFLTAGSIVEDDPASENAERLSPDGKFRKVKFRTAGGNVQRGWLPVDLLAEAEGEERPPIVLWAFLTACVRAEEWINEKSDTGTNFVNADYLVALAIYESKIANLGNETPGTDAVGPFQITSARWKEFLDKVGGTEFSEDDRDNVSDQIFGAAFLAREDARAISDAVTEHARAGGAAIDETGPYIPTYSDVFIAAVVSPLAAITLRKLQLDGRDDTQISVLVDGLAADRKKEMERIFRHNHHILKVDKREAEARGIESGPRSVKDLYVVVEEKLTELLASAFKLMQENVPELLPVVPPAGEAGAPWLPIALREQTDPWQNGQLQEGSASGTKRVLEYFRVMGAPQTRVLHWCGAFVSFCLKEAGGEFAASLVKEPGFAKSWKVWGNQSIPLGTNEIPAGAMIVMAQPPDRRTTGHVAFCSPNQSGKPGKITLLGGNQSDSVRDSDFDRAKVVAIRWLGPPPGSIDLSGDDSIPAGQGIAWGRFVDKKFGSDAFKKKVIQIAGRLQCDPNFLMAAMAFETGRSFSAKQRNLAGGSATGLIQFMPTTAAELGTSTAALAAMTEVKQLDFVEKYMVGRARGRPFKHLSDVYMAILWPKAFGKSAGTAIFVRPDKPYRNNSGLDINRDGTVTVGEATAKVAEQLRRGLLPENRG